jgi:hypothetical protein
MMRKLWNPAAVCMALVCAGPALAQTQTAERVAAHTDWAVFVAGDPKECYIVSPPTSSRATRGGQAVEVRRGDVRLFVAYRPDENVENEVSFTGGYPFEAGSTVEMDVGGREFGLTPGTGDASEWAWTAPSDDASAVSALRGGSTATLTGVSARGTTTIDTFPLMGFTAADTDAQSRCQ